MGSAPWRESRILRLGQRAGDKVKAVLSPEEFTVDAVGGRPENTVVDGLLGIGVVPCLHRLRLCLLCLLYTSDAADE